jgi:GPH family glycoside/pentoside/hexuronide:cation symporter
LDSAVTTIDRAAVMAEVSGGTPPALNAQRKRTLFAYGGLALPLSIAEIPIILYLPAFYAQELRLKAGLVGAVFLLARCWDGLSDMLVGWLSDRTTSRLGRRKPWVLVGAPFLMISTWLLCNPPKSAGLTYLCLWAVVFYTSFTSVKIPHLSWGTELATDYVERSRVTTFREAFTMLGNLFFVAAPLIFLSESPSLREVLSLIAVATLVTVPLAAIPLVAWVSDLARPNRVRTHFLKELAELTKDRVLGRFLLARFIFATEEGIVNSLLLFLFAVGLRLPTRTFFWAILILYIATLFALPATLRLAKYEEKHRILAGGVALQALVFGMVALIPGGNFGVVAALYIALGIANTAMLSLPTSILADIIDHGEVLSGERRSGTYVAVDNLVYKLGMATGVGAAFGILALIGYDPSAAQHSAADARNIRLLGFGLPSLLAAGASILYLSHPITRDIQRRLRQTIDLRNAGCV